MNILDLINFMTVAGRDNFCSSLVPVWTILGYVIFGIKVVVPILLIISGMIDLAQAVMKQDEKDIKKAQSLLVKKLIAAVLVYLVITIVTIVVGLVSSDNWDTCTTCALHPFDEVEITNEDGSKEKKPCYIVAP